MEDIDLAYLRHHWAGAYKITREGGQYVARRRDDGSLVRTNTAEALLAEIRDDYKTRPVPREAAP